MCNIQTQTQNCAEQNQSNLKFAKCVSISVCIANASCLINQAIYFPTTHCGQNNCRANIAEKSSTLLLSFATWSSLLKTIAFQSWKIFVQQFDSCTFLRKLRKTAKRFEPRISILKLLLQLLSALSKWLHFNLINDHPTLIITAVSPPEEHFGQICISHKKMTTVHIPVFQYLA